MRHVNELANFKQTNSEPEVARTANSSYKKLGFQWLIEHSTSHQLLCYLDSFVLRNPQLRIAAKRQAVKKQPSLFLLLIYVR